MRRIDPAPSTQRTLPHRQKTPQGSLEVNGENYKIVLLTLARVRTLDVPPAQGLLRDAGIVVIHGAISLNQGVDIAVNLVENYLRLTGYMTLSEFEVQRRDEKGRFKAVTDVDIMAIRFPGDVYLGDPHREPDYELLVIDDPVLELEPDTIDVIVGEVKQGKADLNPGIKDHGVLHSMLRRVEWIYGDALDSVIRGLQRDGAHRAASRGGGEVRTRLVAFGRSDFSNTNTIALGHIVTTMLTFFQEHEDAFRPIQFREPAPALLRLLLKSGFDVREEHPDRRR